MSNNLENIIICQFIEPKIKPKRVKITNKCIFKDCNTVPSFNHPNPTNKASYCFEHKKPDMINIKKPRCSSLDCSISATFNLPGEKKPIYCVKHKTVDSVNVVSPQCKENNCKKRPAFNFKHIKTPIYCNLHKLDGMENVISIRCIIENCDIQCCYNDSDKKIPLYCMIHKLPEMIDVLNKKCLFENCTIQPCYNYTNEKRGIYCSYHRLDGMVNVKDPVCEYPSCNKRSIFNYEGEKKGKYCVSHKLDNMIDITHPKCNTPMCYIRSQEKYDFYCLRCYINIFPDKPVVRNYKTKERNVVENVLQQFPDFTWVSDKRIFDGCSKRRPDLLLDLGYQIVIIEIDENQHTEYDCSCENKRIMEISQDLGYRPIVFIRFNPDNYIEKDGKKVGSEWHTNKTGLFVINPKKQNLWQKRLNTLYEQIRYWSENKTEKMIETIHLFYDENLDH
jgi:hypothetical protein